MQTRLFRKTITFGYILIAMLIGGIAYTSFYEWRKLESLEEENRHIDKFRLQLHDAYVQMIEFSLLGETILEWDYHDLENYHSQRMSMDSILQRFKVTYPSERIDSLRYLLKDKERQMRLIVQVLDEQQTLNEKIARQVPVIVQKSVQEQPQKPKRKGFLGIFGKKEKPKTTETTTMLRSFNRNVMAEQQAHRKQLSEYADSLASRNAELNHQLHVFVSQMDEKVQADLQKREDEIIAMREQSYIHIGCLTGFVLMLLIISYLIIHRNANCIRRYEKKTVKLIRQQKFSIQQNDELIASRKKAVHTIIHELRSPLTAIIGYAEMIEVENDTDKTGTYIQSIRQSSDRMRDMLCTLLSFFRLDNGKEEVKISPCP